MRHCFALDLRDDPNLIARYEELHRQVWPDVVRHIREHGVLSMEIYRLGTRLLMIMETDDAIFDADRMARAAETNAAVRQWEDLMWRFQAPTPWTPTGQKWMPMQRIFDLRQF
ncbi:L-fucose mutarotase [Paraburkholderia domus]|jgi:L-rhamnose mutarotase|uniref:L-fucose mutarotase n=1 Tax=Paraburkholderia domus TaxID=2793075 RepID=A0A9N8QXI0_9BURK|nr:L-rhamnose mutarotase [Paraburkholderia domus]MBK5060847.1 L-rhamnose mutarotase [Burkholderia sp. R-70199]MBK5085859.1 L-rhamnose mutarotase [Burkholderia sp. R-69927]MBK5120557.1 L-rhamnose mutarotase [Burkholderia sp. R-69980]MBK5166046.1 L-rhamnose mutarotase [Burkholderia sp. R-70211]MBK5180603.1 L-rhamnose mutarotase [Burkholderia sp. R-69749]MCI0146210.1 L-rhamnose mutarotase [Paraburkholderia sediminicola]